MGHARLIFLLCTPSRGTPAPRLNPAAQLMPSMGEGTVEAAAAGAAGAAEGDLDPRFAVSARRVVSTRWCCPIDPKTGVGFYVPIPDVPWCWYIYLQNWVILGVNVGKYSSTMEHL